MKKSRRLKHFKANYTLHITTEPRPDLEQKMLETIDECVKLGHKYILNGHTTERDIKRIQKDINLTRKNNTYKAQVALHIHHYSRVWFDVDEYTVKLNNVLQLAPTSVKKDQIKTQPKNISAFQ